MSHIKSHSYIETPYSFFNLSIVIVDVMGMVIEVWCAKRI